MAKYGYLNRTTVDEHDEQAFADVFSLVPCENISIEQMWTHGETDRPAFERVLNSLSSGDVLYISSIDRLGLDAEDSVRLWYYITREKSADIIVLDDKKLNSRDNGKLTEKQLRLSAKKAFTSLTAYYCNGKSN